MSERRTRTSDEEESSGPNLWSYTTVTGDSLPSIAEDYGHPGEWQLLYEANAWIPDPHSIYPGMELLLPAGWGEEQVDTSSSTMTGSSIAGNVVANGDRLNTGSGSGSVTSSSEI
jgi:hypothetical protein